MSMAYPRVTASAWGEAKDGKSHFGLTFPSPIKAIEVGETGIEDLLPKFRAEGKVIDYVPLIIPVFSPSVSDHAQLLREFERVVLATVNEYKEGGTLLIDSGSRLWRHVRIVKTDEAHEEAQRKKKNQADYELANDYFEQIIQVVRRNSLLNLVMIHRHREKFAMVMNDSGNQVLQATGEVEARDYKGMENMMQIQVRCGKGLWFNPRTKESEQVFMHTIEHNRFNKPLEGRRVKEMDYQKLMELTFGKVVPDVPAGT